MIQIIVTGQVKTLAEMEGSGQAKRYFVAEVHEKVWNGKTNEIRIWDVQLDAYTGDQLRKAMVQIKYFGFICDALKFSYELQGVDKHLVVWVSARGRSYFTL